MEEMWFFQFKKLNIPITWFINGWQAHAPSPLLSPSPLNNWIVPYTSFQALNFHNCPFAFRAMHPRIIHLYQCVYYWNTQLTNWKQICNLLMTNNQSQHVKQDWNCWEHVWLWPNPLWLTKLYSLLKRYSGFTFCYRYSTCTYEAVSESPILHLYCNILLTNLVYNLQILATVKLQINFRCWLICPRKNKCKQCWI